MFNDRDTAYVIFFFIVAVFVVINNGNLESQIDDLQKQVEEYEQQIVEFEQKIEDLEQEKDNYLNKLNTINTISTDRDYNYNDLLDDIEEESEIL